MVTLRLPDHPVAVDPRVWATLLLQVQVAVNLTAVADCRDGD
jgi:hypothetical protein